jgi:hypothetical protein
MPATRRRTATKLIRFHPDELWRITELGAPVTAPQAAIAFQGRRMLKDLLLGREAEREE